MRSASTHGSLTVLHLNRLAPSRRDIATALQTLRRRVAVGLARLWRDWSARRAQRRKLAEMERLDARMLRDIGLTRWNVDPDAPLGTTAGTVRRRH